MLLLALQAQVMLVRRAQARRYRWGIARLLRRLCTCRRRCAAARSDTAPLPDTALLSDTALLAAVLRMPVEAAQSAEDLLTSVVGALVREGRLRYAALELVDPDQPAPRGVLARVSMGREVANPLELPVVSRGRVLGRLLVDPDRGGPRRDLCWAGGLSGSHPLNTYLGLIFDNLLLRDQLARAAERARLERERMELDRDSERRRLRHDIHDGLGPTLASIGMRAEIARLLLDRQDVQGARRILTTLAESHQDMIRDLRRLVDGLGPLTLSQFGLVRAIRRHVEAMGQGVPGAELGRLVAFTVEVADDLGELPSEVEIAAFRICMEATTNVVRHARATHCRIDLRREADQLVIRVRDDGRGLPPDHKAGLGLESIADRTAELGGTCVVAPHRDGGTEVAAWLPVHLPGAGAGTGTGGPSPKRPGGIPGRSGQLSHDAGTPGRRR